REPKKPPQEDDTSLDWLWQKLRNLADLLAGIAGAAELLLWAAVLALILRVALKYGSWLKRFPVGSLRRRRHYQPQTLFGMEVSRV
ncbi:hypothetical protein, partial [Vibrio parahaemolyticus]|uniref:hypothetical protein n=1 Tax=Vibrio parahaemolyticus TaxID=670 RepID=UPI002110F8E7